MKKSLLIGIVILFFIVLAFGIVFIYFSKQNYSYGERKNDSDYYGRQESPYQDFERNDEENFLVDVPVNLALPFDVENMGGGNEFYTPFGLIRHERDKGRGHAGIDVPLSKGDKIYALSDGTIIINEPAIDGGEGNNSEGNNVVLLIAEGDRKGEGWAFLYEHIHLNSEINVGSQVSKKQIIGESALSNGNNHLGLVYYFNNFQYTREPKCWAEHLNAEDKQKLLNAWEEVRKSSKFIESWRDAFEDGAYPYRALLNKNNFPSGPQLCYEYGLDVREFG